ncbi:MAG TPA: GrpB family protein [Thermomicrobiales bacterium]|nr:GrpB family protein [Thermomicrobiales bacterium]
MSGLIGRYEYIRYQDPAAALRPYDPRYPEVARRVIDLIRSRMPDAEVEHVGSTAIPGCAGKGVVDLMLVYPPGRLAAARDALDGLGFQRHDRRGAFPEERPVRIGTLEDDGETFRLHVHVIAADSPEVATQRHFRDTLRADPALVEVYVARKRAVLAAGVTDGNDYNLGKESFIQRVLDGAATDQT